MSENSSSHEDSEFRSDLDEYMNLIDLSQNFTEEKKQVLIESIRNTMICRILKFMTSQNYQQLLPTSILGALEKKVESISEDIVSKMKEYTDPLTRKFSHQPIRIRKTRILFDKVSFLSYFRANQQRKPNGKKFVICPVSGTELVHPIKHQSKHLSKQLVKFRRHTYHKAMELFEVILHFFEVCKPEDNLSKLESDVLKIMECYEIIRKPDTLLLFDYLTLKIQIILYFREVGGRSTEEEIDLRLRALSSAIFEVGMRFHENRDLENTIARLEKDVIMDEEIVRYLSPSQVGKMKEVLMISYREASMRAIEKEDEEGAIKLESKCVEYLMSVLESVVTAGRPRRKKRRDDDEEEEEGDEETEGERGGDEDQGGKERKFDLLHEYSQYFPYNDRIFESVFQMLGEEGKKYLSRGLTIVDILLGEAEGNDRVRRERSNKEEEEEEEGEVQNNNDNNNSEEGEENKKLKGKALKMLKTLKEFDERSLDVNRRLKDVYICMGRTEDAMNVIMFLIRILESEEEKEELMEEALRINPSNTMLAEYACEDAVKKNDCERIKNVTHVPKEEEEQLINELKECLNNNDSEEQQHTLITKFTNHFRKARRLEEIRTTSFEKLAKGTARQEEVEKLERENRELKEKCKGYRDGEREWRERHDKMKKAARSEIDTRGKLEKRTEEVWQLNRDYEYLFEGFKKDLNITLKKVKEKTDPKELDEIAREIKKQQQQQGENNNKEKKKKKKQTRPSTTTSPSHQRSQQPKSRPQHHQEKQQQREPYQKREEEKNYQKYNSREDRGGGGRNRDDRGGKMNYGGSTPSEPSWSNGGGRRYGNNRGGGGGGYGNYRGRGGY